MITLTASAIAEIKRLKEVNNHIEDGVRIQVLPGGCSGFSYGMTFDNQKEFDSVTEQDGVKVLVDQESLPYLNGTELDYIDGLMGKGFKFNNPNATRNCGCGESFSV